MKQWLGIFLWSQLGWATELKIPVFIKLEGKIYSALELNQKYHPPKNLKLPEYFYLGLDYPSFQKANYDYWNGYPQRVLDFNDHYKLKGRLMIESYPGELNTATLKTCYRGHPKELLDLFYEGTDLNYTEDLSIMVVKTKNNDYLDPDYLREHQSSQSALSFVQSSFDLWNRKIESQKVKIFFSLNGIYKDKTTHRSAVVPSCGE